MLGRSLKKLTPKQLGDEDEVDEDVRAEADRVVVGGADNDVVKVRGLRASTYVSLPFSERYLSCMARHTVCVCALLVY